RGRADLGGGDRQWRHGLRLPVRVFSRHDRTARGGRPLLRHARAPAEVRSMDGVGEADRRCDHACNGAVLLHPGGNGMVNSSTGGPMSPRTTFAALAVAYCLLLPAD